MSLAADALAKLAELLRDNDPPVFHLIAHTVNARPDLHLSPVPDNSPPRVKGNAMWEWARLLDVEPTLTATTGDWLRYDLTVDDFAGARLVVGCYLPREAVLTVTR